jgi:hypothetical protein
MLNQSNQPTQSGHFSYMDPPHQKMSSSTHRDLYDATNSHRFLLGFGLERSGCTPQMALVVVTTRRGFQLTEKICLMWHNPHRLRSRVFRMHSTDGTSGGYYMSPHKKPFFFSHFIALVHMHSVLLDVCSRNIHFLFFFLPSSTHVRGLSLFSCILPCYLPPNYPGLKCLNGCVN